MKEIQMEESWKGLMWEEFEKEYFQNLVRKLYQEKEEGGQIYPKASQIFKAFDLSPIDKTKVVILGQDPYHGKGQAMGLSFSVPRNVKTPPSLKNIFKELNADLGIEVPNHGDLTPWAEQGVLLLNAILTVVAGESASHRSIGWEQFTNAVIRQISMQKENIVFMLWGNFAKSKAPLIDSTKHLVLEAAHPSPLAGGAYFGSRHFSKCNEYLQKHGKTAIHWQLEP